MKSKKLLSALVMVAVIASASMPAFAAEYQTPAEACAGVTGKTVETVQSERQTGKTYGTIAEEAGALDAFKAEVLAIKTDTINKQVKQGYLAQDQADKMIAAIIDRQAVCDGSGSQGLGLGLGSGNGQGAGQGSGIGGGQGNGNGRGQGRGAGQGQGSGMGGNNGRGGGQGRGLRDGSCYY